MATPSLPKPARIEAPGWANLAAFCADCPFQITCPLSTVAEVESCPLVLAQVVEDRERKKPRLRATLNHERPWHIIREPFKVVDPEDLATASQHLRENERTQIEARLAWIETHKEETR